MKKIFILFLFISFTFPVLGQMVNSKYEVHKAMKNLSAINGRWEGRGWILNAMGKKSYSNVTENFQWKLDSTIIMVEGVGKKDDGTIVHNALGIISYDIFKKKYSMNSYVARGLSTNANFEVLEANKKFRWWFEDNSGGIFRYTTTTDSKHWKEEGEYSGDGKTWKKFFEMNLGKAAK